MYSYLDWMYENTYTTTTGTLKMHGKYFCSLKYFQEGTESFQGIIVKSKGVSRPLKTKVPVQELFSVKYCIHHVQNRSFQWQSES